MSGGGGVDGFCDFLIGVDVLIDFLILEGLAEARGCRMGGDTEIPLVALTEPVLPHGDELLSGGDTRFHGESELDNEGMDVRTWLLLLDDLGGEIGEALGFECRPEGDLVWEGNGLFAGSGDFRSGRFGVEGRERGGIAREDSSAPLFEGREGRGSGELTGLYDRG